MCGLRAARRALRCLAARSQRRASVCPRLRHWTIVDTVLHRRTVGRQSARRLSAIYDHHAGRRCHQHHRSEVKRHHTTGHRCHRRYTHTRTHTHTHTRLTALCPGLPGWAGTRKVKPIWILLKQEKVSGSGINWAICKSAPCSRQITMPAPHHSVFYRPDALPAAQPTASKH